MRGAEIIPIRVAEVALPAAHPEGEGPCDVFAFLVRDGEAAFLIDTGVGEDNPVIEMLYKPRRVDLLRALAGHGVAPGSLNAVVNSHLHFDHCGNNRLFPGTPIFVQRAEYEAASAPHYTVSSWLHFEREDYRLISGSHQLSGNVEIIPTPGHTPGHQSVHVRTELGLQLVVAQAAYSSAEFAHSHESRLKARSDAWSSAEYVESLSQLHSLQPVRAYFSHDATPWQSAA